MECLWELMFLINTIPLEMWVLWVNADSLLVWNDIDSFKRGYAMTFLMIINY